LAHDHVVELLNFTAGCRHHIISCRLAFRTDLAGFVIVRLVIAMSNPGRCDVINMTFRADMTLHLPQYAYFPTVTFCSFAIFTIFKGDIQAMDIR
jgi:hypothetical protein